MNNWIAGARPRTLPAAIVPVLVGTAVAIDLGDAIWWRAAVALIVALALQVGVNFANDYSDGVRGTDADRVGPVRLVASGVVLPSAVKRAAFLSFAVAAVAGLMLALVVNPWLILLGGACLLAAWYYTGGKRPYGYSGFGEVAVFVFFGLVAVMGTAYVQLERVTWLSFATAVPVGLLAVALLVVNNLRDIPGDTTSGKRTLAVLLGDARTRVLYAVCVLAPFSFIPLIAVVSGAPLVWLVLLVVIWAVGPLTRVLRQAHGSELIAVLKGTAELQLSYGWVLSLTLVLS